MKRRKIEWKNGVNFIGYFEKNPPFLNSTEDTVEMVRKNEVFEKRIVPMSKRWIEKVRMFLCYIKKNDLGFWFLKRCFSLCYAIGYCSFMKS